MTKDEIKQVLNDLNLIYPRMFKDIEDPRRRDRYVDLYMKHFGNYTYSQVESAIDRYLKGEKGQYQPSFSDLLAYVKEESHRTSEDTERRIETPEEVMYQLYLEEMQKPADKRNEWLCRQALPYAKLFNDEQAYIKYFGKPRKEFEKL